MKQHPDVARCHVLAPAPRPRSLCNVRIGVRRPDVRLRTYQIELDPRPFDRHSRLNFSWKEPLLPRVCCVPDHVANKLLTAYPWQTGAL